MSARALLSLLTPTMTLSLLLFLFLSPHLLSAQEDIEIHLTAEELANLPSDNDADMAEDLGNFMADFFHDSNAQVTMDLDMFKDLYQELSTFEDAARSGDVDYIQTAIEFLAPLQKYDVSAPCLSDLSHFLWTTYNYARTAAKARQCESCNCTQAYKPEFAKYQWIFNVVDSMGKVPAAIFGGNNLWTGSWYTCRKIGVKKNFQG